jgi:hypothetical protein
LYSEYLTKEALKGFGDFTVKRQVNRTVKYADDLLLLAKEKTILQGMIDRLIEIGRRCGMEINVKKTKVMRISRQPSPIQIKNNRSMWNFKYLGSIITNDARCTREIKSSIAMEKAVSYKKKTLFTSKLDLI